MPVGPLLDLRLMRSKCALTKKKVLPIDRAVQHPCCRRPQLRRHVRTLHIRHAWQERQADEDGDMMAQKAASRRRRNLCRWLP